MPNERRVVMGALLILGVVTGLLFIACWWADRTPAAEPERYPQPTHVRLLNDQEPTRP